MSERSVGLAHLPRVPRPHLVALALGFVLAGEGAAGQGAPGPYGVAVTHDVMVPMRDGVRLATDVYLPTRDDVPISARVPTILVRTPYSKDNAPQVRSFVNPSYFASHGYAVVVQDTRGRHKSEGVWHMLTDDGPDGYDTANWIGSQAWSNGDVGTAGISYFGGTQHALAMSGARQLKTVIHTPLKLAPEYEDWLVQAMGHGTDDQFWAQNDIIDRAERYKDIPVYLVGGWYDSWAGSTVANYVALSKRLTGPVYLMMGPWIHGGQTQSAHGQVSFGPEAAIPDRAAWQREWFDHFLKGLDNSVGKAPPFGSRVRIFVMGTGSHANDAQGRMTHGGYWRNENEWPLARTQYTHYYLKSGGGLVTTPPTAEQSSTTFRFHPRDPVPTIGGNISFGNGIMLQGAWDQRGGDSVWNWPRPIALSARKDVLVFETVPLDTDVEVTGQIVVKLWASSNRLDTDFTAKVIDVHPPSPDYPEGFDLNIEDGIIRARFRDSLTREELMDPGKIYEFTIALYPTSNVFQKGHRIRVDISSSNFPRFDANPNTGEPLNDNHGVLVATNTIYHDRAHPSHVVLPVIPAPGR